MLNPWKELKKIGSELIEARAKISFLQEGIVKALGAVSEEREKSEKRLDDAIASMAEQLAASREMMTIATTECAVFDANLGPESMVFSLAVDLATINDFRRRNDIDKELTRLFSEAVARETQGFDGAREAEMAHLREMIYARIEELIESWRKQTPSDVMDSFYPGMQNQYATVYGMPLPVIMELRRQYLKGNGEFPMTPHTVKAFFDRRIRGPQRPNPRSDYTGRDVDHAFRRSTPYREHPHADAPPLVSAPDEGVVLQDPGTPGIHGDQPAEGKTLSPDHPAHPERGR